MPKKLNIWIIVFLLHILYSSQVHASKHECLAPDSFVFKTWHTWLGKYRSQTFDENGKMRRFSRQTFFNSLKSTRWDENGNLVKRTIQKPWPALGGVIISRNKIYNKNGKCIQKEFTKIRVGYIGKRTLESRIFVYDGKGKLLSKTETKQDK